MNRMTSLQANQLSASTYLNLPPLRMARPIMAIIRSVFFAVYFIDTLLQGVAAVTSFGETSCELFIGHPELSILSFFTQQCKIQKHLGCPVRDGKEQSLETEDAPVMDMGKHPADVLHAPSRLGIVRVIDYQADRAFLAPGTESDLRPKLKGEVAYSGGYPFSISGDIRSLPS